MSYTFPPNVQQLVDLKMATGQYSTHDDLLLRALTVLDDYDQSVIDLLEGIEDEQAGRTRPLAEADAEIRRRLGFAS